MNRTESEQMILKSRADPLLVCPLCKGKLKGEICISCGAKFARRGNFVALLPPGKIYRRISNVYSNYAERHDQYYNSLAGLKYFREMEMFALIYALSLTRHARAVDVGCGPGRYTSVLCKHFNNVYAVDISRVMLQKLRENIRDCNNIFPILASSDYLPFPDSIFDLYVSFFGAINHSTTRTLDEAIRVLKKDGIMVVSFGSPLPMWRCGRPFPHWVSTLGGSVPMVHYPASWFKEYITKRGMKIIKIRAVHWLLPMKFKKSPNKLLYLVDRTLGDKYPFNRMGSYTIVLARKVK